MVPVVVSASLQQGVVWDRRLGLALDGVLASVVRRLSAPAGTAGSLIDGGLSVEEPRMWELPLAKCDGGGDWHWACGHGVAVDGEGVAVPSGVPDVKQLSQRPDERRAALTAARIPADVGGRRGRFRPRLRPVLTTPAVSVQWRALGVPDALQSLLGYVTAVGGRRGIGEGAVLRWDVTPVEVEDVYAFVHLVNGHLSRPVPEVCARTLGVEFATVRAGIRPPYFHPAEQRLLAVPTEVA